MKKNERRKKDIGFGQNPSYQDFEVPPFGKKDRPFPMKKCYFS
jgi:hypothetical protein